MNTILISGRRKSGKSTLAQVLIDFQDILFPGKSVLRAPFAAPIKNFCVEILGLPHELVWGSDEQKETLTQYKWEDMPHYADICAANSRHNMESRKTGDGPSDFEWVHWQWKRGHYPEREFLPTYRHDPTGPMTIRQIQQEVGTGMGRKMDPDLWVKAWKRANYFPEDPGRIVIADDCRFPNELEMGREVGGYCLRLTRGQRGDNHASEVSLSDEDGRFDCILDNRDVKLESTVTQFLGALATAGLVRFDAVEAVLVEMFAGAA